MAVATVAGPLTGCRVLELGSIVAGPFCGRLLADFGAEVIKVEPTEGDGVRGMGRHFNNKSLNAASILRNKSLIAMDLRTKKGQDIVRGLVAKSDIVIENFRPGVMERWGLGYVELARANPGVVMVRISGYGQSGPYSQRPGFGVIAEAMSGLRYITGDPDRPPARVGVPLTDYITGLYAAFGAMMALHHRNLTGQGQCIDAALYESAFSFMEFLVPSYEKLGVVANRSGSAFPGSAPNNLYPTGDQGFIHITGFHDAVFKRLVTVMERPELLVDPRFATAVDRAKNHTAIDEIVAQWTTQHTAAQLEELLLAAEVPVGKIYSVADIFNDAHFRAREMLVDAPDDDLGTIKLVAPVPKLSRTPGHIRKSGGRVGQDTSRVLTDVLGFSNEEIRSLERERVIFCDRTGENRDAG